MMKTINIFGGPGSGKSTTASGLFHEMKKHWIQSEYVQEFAKELVWSDSSHMLSEQNYIFAEQEHRLNRLRRKVDVAVADSPLLLSSFYAPPEYPDSFHQSVFDFFHTYDNLNIFVERSHEYMLEGRLQSEVEADTMASKMKEYLTANGIPFWAISASDAAPRRLLGWLVSQGHVTLPAGMVDRFEAQIVPDMAAAPAGWIRYNDTPAWRSGQRIVRADLSGMRTVGAGQPV
jgi:nicotinamide riboside kinase